MQPAGKRGVDSMAGRESRQGGEAFSGGGSGEGGIERGQGEAAADREFEVAGVVGGEVIAFGETVDAGPSNSLVLPSILMGRSKRAAARQRLVRWASTSHVESPSGEHLPLRAAIGQERRPYSCPHEYARHQPRERARCGNTGRWRPSHPGPTSTPSVFDQLLDGDIIAERQILA